MSFKDRMKERLASSLGFFGFILWYIISITFSVAPLIIIDLPFWADVLIIMALTSIPMFDETVGTGLWIWGLVVAINGRQDTFAIIYYVFFIIRTIPFVLQVISLVPILFQKDKY